MCKSYSDPIQLSFYDLFLICLRGPFIASAPMNLQFACIAHWHRSPF